MFKIKFITCLLLSCLWFNCYAGSSCQAVAPHPSVFMQAGNQAVKILNVLKQKKPLVALLARVGTDLSKYHLHYSHVAFLVWDKQHNNWNVIHLLNHCGTPYSSIYNQGLMNFFLDGVVNFDAKLVIPNPKLQKKLFNILSSPKKLALHDKNYSMLAYPFSTEYQNSNQWVLEVLAYAISDRPDRATLQAWLRQENYTPSMVNLSGFEQLGAQLFKANVKFDDHPLEQRISNNYAFVSVDSVFQFLADQHDIILAKNFLAQ